MWTENESRTRITLIRSWGAVSILLLVFVSSLKAQSNMRFSLLELSGVGQICTKSHQNGFLWIGAYNGLYRFDGKELLNFPIHDPNSEVLHSQNIQSDLFFDREGKFWFSTYEAIHTFSPVSRSFKTFQLSVNTQTIKEGYRLIDIDTTKEVLRLKAGDELFEYHYPSQTETALYQATKGNFFATGKTNQGEEVVLALPWFFGKGFEVFTKDSKYGNWSKNSVQEPGYFVNAVYVGDGQFYIGGEFGLYLFSVESGGIELHKVLQAELPDRPITYLRHDPMENRLILGFKSGDLYSYGLTNNTVTLLLDQDGKISSLWLDNNNNLWVGLENGCWVENRQRSGVQLDTSDIISIAVLNSSVYGLNGVGRLSRIISEQQGLNMYPVGNAQLSANEIFAGIDQSIYALKDSELSIYDIAKDTVATYNFTHDLGRGFISFENGKTLAVRQNEIGWLEPGTPARLLSVRDSARLNGSSSYTTLFRITENIVAITLDANSLKFAEFIDGDLNIIDSVYVGVEILNVLASSTSPTVVYIATNTGLWSYTEQELTKVNFPSYFRGQLSISNCQFDHEGNLWLATDMGLFRYRDNKFTLFNERDGVPGLSYLSRVAPVFSDGSIGFLSTKGIVHLKPEKMVVNRLPAYPYLAKFWINNAEVEYSSSIYSTQKISSRYTDNSLKFKIAVASGSLPEEKYKIEYRLVNYNDEISIVNEGGIISYAQLIPGDYHLAVSAINHHGIRVGEANFEITIRPPFYQRWWFRLTVVGAIIIILLIIHYSLVSRAIAKEARLRESQSRIASERDRIAGEVHDDLGGQLSSILFLSQSILLSSRGLQDNGEIKRIYELSKGSLQNVRDIIFALDTRRASLGDLVEQLENIGKEIFRDHKVIFNYRSNLLNPKLMLSSKQKRHLTLLVKESYHNIVKHSSAEWALLEVQQNELKTFSISISDDGVGFDSASPAISTINGGYGLENMRRKAAEIDASLNISSTINQGTIIIISGPLNLKAK